MLGGGDVQVSSRVWEEVGQPSMRGDGYTLESGETPAGPQLPHRDTLFPAQAFFPTATIRDPPTLELQSIPGFERRNAEGDRPAPLRRGGLVPSIQPLRPRPLMNL